MPKSTKILFTLLVIFTIAGIILTVAGSEGLLAEPDTPEPGNNDVRDYPVANLQVVTSRDNQGQCSALASWDVPSNLNDYQKTTGNDTSGITWHVNLYVANKHVYEGGDVDFEQRLWRSPQESSYCGKSGELRIDTYRDGNKISNGSYSKITFTFNAAEFKGSADACGPSNVVANIDHSERDETHIKSDLYITWEDPKESGAGQRCDSCGSGGYKVFFKDNEITSSPIRGKYYNDDDFKENELGIYTIKALMYDSGVCGQSTVNVSSLFPAGTIWSKNTDGSSSSNPTDTNKLSGGTTASNAQGGASIEECKNQCAIAQKCYTGVGKSLLDPICNGFCSFNCYILQLMADMFTWSFGFLSNAVGLS